MHGWLAGGSSARGHLPTPLRHRKYIRATRFPIHPSRRPLVVGWSAMSDMWLPDDQDPRTAGNPQGEKATYVEYLANYRLTLQLKCDGLTPEQLATRSVPPSTLSLLGLVRHLARVENNWFQRTAQANGLDRIYWSAEDDDLDFNAVEPSQECVDD